MVCVISSSTQTDAVHWPQERLLHCQLKRHLNWLSTPFSCCAADTDSEGGGAWITHVWSSALLLLLLLLLLMMMMELLQ
jgi:hypothetical protein